MLAQSCCSSFIFKSFDTSWQSPGFSQLGVPHLPLLFIHLFYYFPFPGFPPIILIYSLYYFLFINAFFHNFNLQIFNIKKLYVSFSKCTICSEHILFSKIFCFWYPSINSLIMYSISEWSELQFCKYGTSCFSCYSN